MGLLGMAYCDVFLFGSATSLFEQTLSQMLICCCDEHEAKGSVKVELLRFDVLEQI